MKPIQTHRSNSKEIRTITSQIFKWWWNWKM